MKFNTNTMIVAAVFIGVGAACTYLWMKKQEEKKTIAATVPGAAATDQPAAGG